MSHDDSNRSYIDVHTANIGCCILHVGFTEVMIGAYWFYVGC